MNIYRRSRLRSSRGHVRMPQRRPWEQWALGGGAALILLVIIILIAGQLGSSEDKQSVISHNRTWLGFDPWTTEPVNQSTVEQLGTYLRDNYIDMVYLEVAAWNNDGALIEGQYAAEFVQTLHTVYPDVKVLVWLRMSGEQLGEFYGARGSLNASRARCERVGF